MKVLNKVALLTIAISAISLTGCVTVTAESNPEKSALTGTAPVGFGHALHEAVKIGDLEGFKGTSIFPITGRVSPNLDTEGAKKALELTLDNAGMLANAENDARYQLNAKVEDSGEIGAWGSESSINGIERNSIIHYALVNLKNGQDVYARSIDSYGESDGGGMAFYLVEKEASEASYKDSFRQLIIDLKSYSN